MKAGRAEEEKEAFQTETQNGTGKSMAQERLTQLKHHCAYLQVLG